MTRCAVLAIVLCAGCDVVFGITGSARSDAGAHADAPPDASGKGGCAADPHDEDADGIPDDCDVCPAFSDPEQQDADGDHVGDACDPRPDNVDHRVAFFGFGGPAVPGELRLIGNWTVQDDQLRITGLDASGDWLAVDDAMETSVVVRTRAHLIAIGGATNAEAQALGLWANVDRTPEGGFPFGTVFEMLAINSTTQLHVLDRHTAATGVEMPSGLMEPGASYDLALVCGPEFGGCRGDLAGPQGTSVMADEDTFVAGGAGLRARGNVVVAFDYLDVTAIGQTAAITP